MKVAMKAKRRPWTAASVFAATAAISSVMLFAGVLLYNGVVYRDVVLSQARERDLRREFVEIPNVDRFHFVAFAIEESRKIVESGLFTSAFRRWWEQTSLFTLFTLDSIYLKVTFCVGFIVFIVAGLYLFFQFQSNKHWMDKAVGMQQQKFAMQMAASKPRKSCAKEEQ
jgi:hypothetical protein